MKWHKRLNNLIDLEPKGGSDYNSMHTLAYVDSKRWGKCSVSEKFLLINESWDDLLEDDQGDIVYKCYELYVMGQLFCDNISSHDYEEALAIHNRIQAYDINENDLYNLIEKYKHKTKQLYKDIR